MFKPLITNFNQATNLLIGGAVLGMFITFGALRLINSANRGAADRQPPSWRISPRAAIVAPGQSIELSAQSLGFEPTSIVWLASHDQITFSPVTDTVTVVNIPADMSSQEVTITAQATLNPGSVIQDAITINIE